MDEEMNYALVKCVNGNFFIVSEHGHDIEAARTAFYSQCMALSNEPSVIRSKIMVCDEFLQPAGDLQATIGHKTDNQAE